MKSNNEYYQANALVQARTKKYDIVEHRLFRMAVAELNPKLKNSKYYDEEFPTFHLSTEEVIKEFGEDKNDHRIYEKLLLAYRNMIQSYVEVGDPKNPKLYPIFAEIDFSVKNGLTIQFNPKMKPFLLNFESGNYTRCFLEMAFELSSKYSLILLELMLQYRGTQKNKIIERRITPEELRFALGVKDNTYELMSNFTRKVIDPAIKEIDQKTNYYINPDYKIERGRWRKIKAFVFTMILPDADAEGQPKIKPKKEEIPALDTSANSDAPSSEIVPNEMGETTSEEFSSKESKESSQPPTTKDTLERQEPQKKLEEYTEDEIYALEKLLKFKINERKAFEILDKFGTKAVDWAVKDYYNAKNRGVAVNNPAGFIIDKIPQYESSVPTADDIFKLAEGFRAKKEEQRIKEKEETERKKAENDAKEAERLANRKPWQEWEVELLAKNYLQNGNKFSEDEKKFIEEKGWKEIEILRERKYMQYFYPDNAVIQNLARKISEEK